MSKKYWLKWWYGLNKEQQQRYIKNVDHGLEKVNEELRVERLEGEICDESN